MLAIGLMVEILVTVVRYARRREFYAELEEYTDEAACPLWTAEMVDRPSFWEGEVVYDALQAVSKSANDGVAAAQRQLRDYREYVETWVHEAKSPLAAAHLMLENLKEPVHLLAGMRRIQRDAALIGKLEALDDELDRVEGFIEQALFFARSETLDRDYLIRSHSLRALVTSAIKTNARTMIAAHVAPTCKDLDFDVFTDDKWMAFILGQLIQNSVKYANADGGAIRFSARRLDEGLANGVFEIDGRRRRLRRLGSGCPTRLRQRVYRGERQVGQAVDGHRPLSCGAALQKDGPSRLCVLCDGGWLCGHDRVSQQQDAFLRMRPSRHAKWGRAGGAQAGAAKDRIKREASRFAGSFPVVRSFARVRCTSCCRARRSPLRPHAPDHYGRRPRAEHEGGVPLPSGGRDGGRLLHDKDVAVGVAQQERGDGAEQRVLDRREAAGSAEHQVGLDDVEHLVFQGLADAPCAHDDLDLGDIRVLLGLGDLVGDRLRNASSSPLMRSTG